MVAAAAVAAATERRAPVASASSPGGRGRAQALAATSDTTYVGRLTFYPLAIGLFILVDLALRSTGH